MRWLKWAVSSLVVAATALVAAEEQRCFPDDFMFGSATASYQVEGAVKEGGRTPSIWDDFCREKAGVACANVADDFYHRYHEDIQLMKDNGLQSFRFSISWSRAMNWDPETRRMKINPEGIAFYHSLIDELNRKNLEPILTLYHWDLPSELQTQLSPPGWLNDDIVGHFVEYSTLIYREFGHKVKFWTTFNEPYSFVTQGYGTGVHAPGFTGSPTNTYVVAHNLLVAHARAVKVFRDLRADGTVLSDARISIVLVVHYTYPLDPSNPKDVEAAERALQFDMGWFLQPIVSGDYPEVIKQRVGERLPRFTDEESALLKGSYDLFMLNHYASKLVTDCDSPTSETSCDKLTLGWELDKGVDDSRYPEGGRRSSKDKNGNYNCGWFTAYPPGYLALIKWMHKFDTSAQILLTENGWCGNDEIDNPDQLWYYQAYLEQVYKAVHEENIPIIGYTAWSFFDNYEWGSFNPRFGLYYVNFTSQTGTPDYFTASPDTLQRIPRPAAKWFSQLSKSKCLPPNEGWESTPAPKPVAVVTTAPKPTTSAPVASTTSTAAPENLPSPSHINTWSIVGIVVVAVAVVTLIGLAIRRFVLNRGTSGERQPLL